MKDEEEIPMDANEIVQVGKWEAGTEKDYKDLTDKEYKKMLTMGIAMGTVPIILAAYFWLPLFFLIVPYAAGIHGDFKQLNIKLVED